MDRVYIISRYRAKTEHQVEFNKEVARHFCRAIIDEGNAPVAPHLFYTQFLNDDYPDDREHGLNLGLEDLKNCQAFLLVMIDGIISDGMRNELEEVARLGIPGRVVSMTKQEVSAAMKVVR